VLLKFGREGIELDDLAERVEMLERSARGEVTQLLPARRQQDREDQDAEEDE
jgi:hypothetical protein